MLTLIHPKADRLIDHMRNRSFVPQKATKDNQFSTCTMSAEWNWSLSQERQPCYNTHTNPNISDSFTLNISNTSPHGPSRFHRLNEKWESFLFGKPICARAQHIWEVKPSACALIGLLWVLKMWGKKKAWASHLEPLSHKEDLSQLEEPFSFVFKVGEEASKSLLSWSMTHTHHRRKEWTPERMTPVMASLWV